MSLWSQIVNVFRRDRLRGELDEEMQAHIAEAIEHGRDPAEARRAFGSLLRRREDCQDIKLATWLESLRADAVFGFRQLSKNKPVSAAAILSLALAIGACTSAFRLIDALLLRPLPVAAPDRLYFLEYESKDQTGKVDFGDTYEYPLFRELRDAVKDQAELLAISYTSDIDLTYGSDQEMERVYRQYVSGSMFGVFGLQPALGRLLTASDDLKPGEHPYGVISYEYWTRRFGRDPKVLGRTFRTGNRSLQIIGVCEKGFTGTETGKMTDLFVPTMMNTRAVNDPNWGWFRTWARVKPGAAIESLRERLQAAQTANRREYVRSWTNPPPKDKLDEYVYSKLRLESAASGASDIQNRYKRPLGVLALIVALVLLIACANVANLMTAQAGARSKEMALRVSIGAGRLRLLQLVLVEGGLIALAASILGGLFAWWAAPFVVSMIATPGNPVQLDLQWDWRTLGFAAVLALGVALLFAMLPALRASAVKPMAVLRGSDAPHSRRRVINALTGAQVAFCFVILFVTGLFVSTFDRLMKQPLGFSAERVLTLETVSNQGQPIAYWNQVQDHLRSMSQVESAGLSSWALLGGNRRRQGIWIAGKRQQMAPWVLGVTPGWLEAMRIPMLGGRDFRPEDRDPEVAIVNTAFAKEHFEGQNPIGRTIEVEHRKKIVSARVVGYVQDARYADMRETIRPTMYVPFDAADDKGESKKPDWGTFVVRTRGSDPRPLASAFRQEVARARSEFRVSDVRTQVELVQSHTIRERLLAVLSSFFAVVAIVLAGVGLFGVINYAMMQRRREIGIRMALGARPVDVVRSVTAESLVMLAIGTVAGVAAGWACTQWIEALLFGVKPGEPAMLAGPAILLGLVALVAALPPVIHAIRIDPSTMLRSE